MKPHFFAKDFLFRKLFHSVDNSRLILFRIVFGFLLFYHSLSYIISGEVYRNFIRPSFTFTYIGFEFLQPLPGYGMYFYFGLMALLGLLIMLGAWYRLSIISFTLLWFIIYLMQKSGYNNHYYLILLLSFLMIFMPANARCSWDANKNPNIKKSSCPQWINWIFIAQCFVIYFYSALSKLLAPAWLSGKFLTIQFTNLSKRHLIGFIYGQKWFIFFISYGGVFFDLCIVPLLLWKKTRKWAFILACFFHLFNSFTFRIGIFPYLSIVLLLFFMDQDEIKNLFFRNKPPIVYDIQQIKSYTLKQIILVYGLVVYMLFQIILPIRPILFKGNVFWTEEGYRLSWKMMLRTKNGRIHFKIVDPASGKTIVIDPSQFFDASEMMWLSTSPDIIWQYAQRLKNEYRKKGTPNVQVYALDSVSLNRSSYQPFINPAIDLTKVQWNSFKHSDWIMPFREDN